jgi:hypothetical protein
MDSRQGAGSAFTDYYRCPADFARLGVRGQMSPRDGYFRFDGAVAFGHCAGAAPARYASDSLSEVSGSVTVENGTAQLPFDFTEVVTNLREERYRINGYSFLERTTSTDAANRLYYLVRPLMGVGVRKHLQKLRFKGWDRIAFPQWPVDVSVERLMKGAMAELLKAHGRPIPFVWFWPDGAPACSMVTHDVEGPSGLDFCQTIMDLDEAHRVRSSFQLIPEGRGNTWRQVAEAIRRRGFEVNLHDLNHDGRLYLNKDQFLERADRINKYVRELGCGGFRSGAMYREQGWYDAFDFSFDMSVPNAAHLEPQRGGCCTVMPYFVGRLVELPLTRVQDYSLFFILGDYSTGLWQQQANLILQENGLISIITHPDYLIGDAERAVYVKLLGYITELRDAHRVWVALPGEIDAWWRNRDAMRLVPDGDSWRIEGADSHRARVAYATLSGDTVVYSVDRAA